MNRPHPSRLLAVVLGVVLVACTNATSADPPPTEPTVPSETAANEDAASLDEQTAIDLYTALQHAIIQLAPTDPTGIEIEGAGDGIVVEGSPAAEFLTDRLTTIAATGTGPSGDVVDAEALTPPEGNPGQQQTVELCALQQVEIVDIESGQPAAGTPPAAEARYTRIEVVYRNDDGAWLIEDLPQLEAGSPPEDCVPPSIEAEVRANWERYVEALAGWIEASFSVEAREPLQPLVTEEHWQQIEATGPQQPTGWVQGDIAYDLELLSATRTEIVGEWCLDGNRDPDATTLRNGELVKNDGRSLIRARWEFENGEWRSAENDAERGDAQIRAGTFDAPEGHRCL